MVLYELYVGDSFGIVAMVMGSILSVLFVYKMTKRKRASFPDVLGTFEIHVTVKSDGSETEMTNFVEYCKTLSVKAIFILLPTGDFPKQLMTSSYVTGNRESAIADAHALADKLRNEGWTVKRVKIESLVSNQGVPDSDEDALARIKAGLGSYFEFHYKVKCSDDADKVRLTGVGQKYAAHTSRSAFRKNADDGSFINILTLREYDLGRVNAMAKCDALKGDLEKAGFEVIACQREYAVYDDFVELDKGWLKLKGK